MNEAQGVGQKENIALLHVLVVHDRVGSFILAQDAATFAARVSTLHFAACVQLVQIKHTIIRYGK
tara:strand:- start:1759 stop:1953 length:195 start_codon:yes stop_codon:yes gene_type:complete